MEVKLYDIENGYMMIYNLETLKKIGKKSTSSAIISLILSVPSLGMDFEGQFVDPFAAFNKPLSFSPNDSDIEAEYEALRKEAGFSDSNSFQSEDEELLQLEKELELELQNEQEKKENESLKNKSENKNKEIVNYKGNYFIDKLSIISNNLCYWISYLFYGK